MAVGVPVMRPVAASMTRPAGRPAAAYASVSPFGSLALSASATLSPITVFCAPGFASTGLVAGFGSLAMPMRTIFATDGTPASLNTNIM